MAYGRNNLGRKAGPGGSRCDSITDPVAKQRCKNMEAVNTRAASAGPAGTSRVARGLGAARGGILGGGNRGNNRRRRRRTEGFGGPTY